MHRRPLRKVTIDQSYGAKGVLCVGINDGCHSVKVVGGKRALCEGVDIGLLIAITKQDLGGTLDEETISRTIVKFDNSTHALLTRVERHHVDNLLICTNFGE